MLVHKSGILVTHLQSFANNHPTHCLLIPFLTLQLFNEARCSVVVKALCYKPEGSGFDTQ
jgi:hypothetical protein